MSRVRKPQKSGRGSRPRRQPFTSRDVGLWMQVLLMVFVLAVVIIAGRQFARSVSDAIATLTEAPGQQGDALEGPAADASGAPAGDTAVHQAEHPTRVVSTFVNAALESARRHVTTAAPGPSEPPGAPASPDTTP